MDKIKKRPDPFREPLSEAEMELHSQENNERLREFMKFTGLPAIHCKILLQLTHHHKRQRNQHAEEIMAELTGEARHYEIVAAMEELLIDGWIMLDGDGPFGSKDCFRIMANVDVAIKTNNGAILPQPGKGIKDEPILGVYARAVSLRCRNISIDDWIQYAQETAAPIVKKQFGSKTITKLNAAEWGLLAYITSMYLVEEKGPELQHLLDLFSKTSADKMLLRKVMSEEHGQLFKSGLISKDHSFRGATALYPSPFTKKRTTHEPWRSRSDGNKSSPAFTVISHKSIKACTLFFNEKPASKVAEITQLFDKKKFGAYHSLMLKKGKPGGISVVLHGPPGTGKTELARQLARITARDLLFFDVSQQRDMYVGESEKKIKEVFNAYYELAQSSRVTPILLFNEADSVFHTRSDHGIHSSHTDNAVQTILLNELESFNGILIATTNRWGTFDPAFDRRFMYKLRLDVPDQSVRMQLLQHSFNELPAEIALKFAEEFSFTAAQLEQFERHLEISNLLQDSDSVTESLSEKLHAFLLSHSTKKPRLAKRIGFLRERIDSTEMTSVQLNV